MSFQIAIDGPVAAGKGTVARLVALRLGFLYVDTGAMYRTTAFLAKERDVDWKNEQAVADLVSKVRMMLRNPLEEEKDGRQITVLLDDRDVSWAIRTEEISIGASVVAQHAIVRRELVKKQQEIARQANVVMEGRDITFRVLPDAQIKIYLDASVETRAKRRHQELLARGVDTSFEHVYKDIEERDARDMQRGVDPLHVVDSAWVLDTTNLDIEEVVQLIVDKAHQLGA
ncbi:MAG TPA: (d)CMP kinase [Patescibacteria group bacterium]|nr:(d)CMP kinase [Patescibacteria group bacterium]